MSDRATRREIAREAARLYHEATRRTVSDTQMEYIVDAVMEAVVNQLVSGRAVYLSSIGEFDIKRIERARQSNLSGVQAGPGWYLKWQLRPNRTLRQKAKEAYAKSSDE
jgi:nucleoid DNA-binding protein